MELEAVTERGGRRKSAETDLATAEGRERSGQAGARGRPALHLAREAYASGRELVSATAANVLEHQLIQTFAVHQDVP